MKKILFTSAIILGLFSCGGSDSSDNNGEELATLTVEQGKQELEDNAITFLAEIDSYKNDNALTEIKDILDALVIDVAGKSIGSKTFNNLSDLQSGKKDIISINSRLFEDLSLIDDYNEQTGIYQWNSATEEFDKTGESINIVYKIAYNSKNAEFVVSDFKTAIFTADNVEVPITAKASLKVNGKEIFSQVYSASVDYGKYLPNSVKNVVTIGGLVITTTLNNNSNKTLDFKHSYSINGTSLMSYSVIVNGNFNEIDTNGDDLSEDTKVEDILDSSEFSMSFLNAKITGKVTEPSIIPEGDITTIEAVKLLNENVFIDIIINDKSVAKGEFYVDEDEYGDSEPNLRLLFSDGTTADFDTYFGEGFSSVEGKFDDVIDNYTSKFGL